MADAVITIPYPVLPTSPAGIFNVVVKNSSGGTVFTGTENNSPFTVPGLVSGDYTAYVTYAGNTNGWCFTVINCSCPTWTNHLITISGIPPSVVYFLEITFDMSGGFPNCPFTINYDDGVAPNSITISSLADFTSHVGTDYKIKIHVYAPRASWTISSGGTACTAAPVNDFFSCHSPSVPNVSIVEIGSVFNLKLVFANCGATCHEYSISYLQNYVLPLLTPDSGFVDIVLDCGASYPFTVLIPLSNVGTFYLTGTDVAYLYRINDCCGLSIASAVASA